MEHLHTDWENLLSKKQLPHSTRQIKVNFARWRGLFREFPLQLGWHLKASARYVLLVISRVSDHECMIRLGCLDTWLYEVFAGINIATINYKASLVQFMAGHRVGGKPLSEPSIDTLHKCIYMYTLSSLDLLTYRVLLLTVIVKPQRAVISSVSTSTTNMAVWPSRLWWNLSGNSSSATSRRELLRQFPEGKRYSLL